ARTTSTAGTPAISPTSSPLGTWKLSARGANLFGAVTPGLTGVERGVTRPVTVVTGRVTLSRVREPGPGVGGGMAARPLVAYYRVSTPKQGASGLGLDAQVAAVDDFARSHGAVALAAYREVESGKRAARPELAKAVAHARRAGATLVIAKLDRLARNVHFLA